MKSQLFTPLSAAEVAAVIFKIGLNAEKNIFPGEGGGIIFFGKLFKAVKGVFGGGVAMFDDSHINRLLFLSLCKMKRGYDNHFVSASDKFLFSVKTSFHIMYSQYYFFSTCFVKFSGIFSKRVLS